MRMHRKGQYLTPTSTLANDISCKKKKSAQSEAVLNVALVVTKTLTARWRHRPWKLHVWPRVLHLATSSLLQSLLQIWFLPRNIKDWCGVRPPQVAMHRNCYIFLF